MYQKEWSGDSVRARCSQCEPSATLRRRRHARRKTKAMQQKLAGARGSQQMAGRAQSGGMLLMRLKRVRGPPGKAPTLPLDVASAAIAAGTCHN